MGEKARGREGAGAFSLPVTGGASTFIGGSLREAGRGMPRHSTLVRSSEPDDDHLPRGNDVEPLIVSSGGHEQVCGCAVVDQVILSARQKNTLGHVRPKRQRICCAEIDVQPYAQPERGTGG